MSLERFVVIGFIVLVAFIIPPQTAAVIYVRQGTPGEVIVLNESQSYGDATRMSMEFAQDAANQLNISEIQRYVSPDMNALKNLTPKKVAGNIVNAEPTSYTSSGVIYPCNIDSTVSQEGESENLERVGWYHSEPLPEWYAEARQTAKFFNFGLLQKGSRLTKNLQDFREEETILPEDAYPPCVSATGTDMDSTNVAIPDNKLLSLVISFLKQLFSNNTSETSETATVTISNWKINSYGEAMAKTMTGKAGGSTAYLTGDDAEQTSQAKGYVTALKPHRVALAGSHGSQENFEVADTALVTNDTNFELMRENKEFHMCSYIPYKAQGLYVPDNPNDPEKCVFSTGGASCNGETIPNLPDIDQSCSLCNTDELIEFIIQYEPAAAGQLQDTFPETAIEILNAAASKFIIPAPVLLGAMIHEGAFTFDEYDWTEENAVCWSVEGGRIGTTTPFDDSVCRSHQHPSTQSRGPFGWIDTYFKDAISAVINGLSYLGISGYEEFQNQHPNHDPCNFYDSAFAAAAAMSSTQAGRTDRAFTCNSSGGSVSTYTGNGGIVGSCSQWTKERAATVQAVHSPDGLCPAITTTVDAFLRFKCF